MSFHASQKINWLCCGLSLAICSLVLAPNASAQRPSKTGVRSGERHERPDRRHVRPPVKLTAKMFRETRPYSQQEGGEEFRTFNGLFNNLTRPRFGSIFIRLLREAPAQYGPDNSLARQSAANVRVISNTVNHQSASVVNDRGMSDFVWQWGQFLDHDLDLTEFHLPREAANIAIPIGDAAFDPLSTGDREFLFSRSLYAVAPFRDASMVRQQLNEITAWIDGSNVYGSDQERADHLRSFVGGKLRTSDGGEFGDFLPISEDDDQFEAGDIRAGEQSGLTCMHTLFMREHNRLCDEIAADNPNFSDEEIYQRARKKVYAILEAITYNEWLPALMGEDHPLTEYNGYDPSVCPNIANEFSTAAFRFGHTMINNQLRRLSNQGFPINEGDVLLRDAFFNPEIIQQAGIEPLLKGLMSQQAQEIDTNVIGAVRNFLFFGQPGTAQGLDLASLNIQRGRDHGLPDFNTMRVAYGLPALNSFAELTSDPLLQAKLASVYPSVDQLDPWVGFLAEDHAPGSSLGTSAIAVLKDQFERVRDGDRFWYELVFDGEELDEIRNTKLSDIILRNTTLTNVQDNVFFVD